MKKIPTFKTDEEKAKFWDENSFADYISGTEKADIEFGKGEKEVITIRLSRKDATFIKILAKEMGISYSSLIRVWIKEKLLGFRKSAKF